MSVVFPPVEPVVPAFLRVFPNSIHDIPQPLDDSIPAGFAPFDRAFQLATGWNLIWEDGINDACPSPGQAATTGPRGPDRPSRFGGKMRIEDLSRLLPPGIPATSRIYCENMILRLNELLGEVVARQSAAPSSRAGTIPRVRNPGASGRLQPCFLDQFCIVPVVTPDWNHPVLAGELGGCQWLLHTSGSLSVAALAVSGSSDLLASAMLVAQSAFLTAARLETNCRQIHEQIRSSINQMFCGDIHAHSAVWTLDPLMGQAAVCGDERFELRLDRERLRFDSERQQVFPWYRKQVLLATHWSQESKLQFEDINNWMNVTLAHLADQDPHNWQARLGECLESWIPTISCSPDLAVAMVRH